MAAWPAHAWAQPVGSGDPACPRNVGAYLHNGFFFRSEAGVALLEESVVRSAPGDRRSRIWGIGQSSTLSIGGTPAPGLVLGGMLWTARIDPRYVIAGKTVAPDDDSVKLVILRVGPMLDWYPQPRRGFHFELAPSLLIEIENDTKGEPVKPLAFGLTLSSGLGHEWFVSEEFSLGFAAKWVFGWLQRGSGERSEQRVLVIPEFALTGTYH